MLFDVTRTVALSAKITIPPPCTKRDEERQEYTQWTAWRHGTHTHTRAHVLLPSSLSFLGPCLGNFAAYDSRDRLHSVFSVNDWARGPIPRKDSEEERERWCRSKEERRGERGEEGGRSIISNMEPRVPWPLSGPKPGLEFPKIALRGLDSLTDIASFFFIPRFCR